ncbi:MAG: hypothetical protein QGE94_04990 [Desulfobacterales bacterium]|nr:hypothetical protein [Desulfobacterales bacterium]
MCMITADEKRFILANAYVPEHSVDLMTSVAGGESFLIDGYFGCHRGEEIILVRYPLQHKFDANELGTFVDQMRKKFNPSTISLIAPELSKQFASSCMENECDDYYTLNIHDRSNKKGKGRLSSTAWKKLSIEHSTEMGKAQGILSAEFIAEVKLPIRVKNLLLKMPSFVNRSRDSVVLNAWDKNSNLAAFYVVDLSARDFSTYVIGCRSKKCPIPGASDLLFFEMIQMSKVYDKRYIHLGLGVNLGIERFKKKWGGSPTPTYEMCVLNFRKASILDTLRLMRAHT